MNIAKNNLDNNMNSDIKSQNKQYNDDKLEELVMKMKEKFVKNKSKKGRFSRTVWHKL